MRGEGGLERRVRRGQQIAELVDETRKGAAGLVRRQLVEMHGDHAPGTLNRHLHEEGTDREQHGAVGECPKRQDGKREERRNHDHAAPTDPLRERAAENAAEDGADIVDCRDGPHRMRGQAVLHLEKSRIEILGAVAEEVERGHQHHRIEAEAPMRCEDRQCAAARGRRTVPARRFRYASANVEHEQRRQHTHHEHAAPSDDRKEQPVDD